MPYDYPPAHTAVQAVRPVNLRRTRPFVIPTRAELAAARLGRPDQTLRLARHVLQGTTRPKP